MRRIMNLIAAGAVGLTTASAALADVVVVELFTSQGCSSCPPADELLGKLAKRDDVLALSLHVDYWDYLGWKDEFADPAYTKRQQAYAREGGSNMIYTPQMIVGGVTSIVGTRGMELAEAIQKHAVADTGVNVKLGKSANGLTVNLMPGAGTTNKMYVQLVRYQPSQTVDIRSGENAGRTMTYHNVVMSWDVIAEWDGKAELSLKADASVVPGAAVIVQDGSSGPILAAARLD